MNVNLLTIDIMPAGVSNTLHTPPQYDTSTRDKPVCPLAEDRPTQTSSTEIETTDNIVTDAGYTVSEKPALEFREVLREKTKREGPQKSQDHNELKERKEPSDPAKPSDIVRTWLAENAVPIPHSKEGIAVKVEPKAGRELAQLIAGLKTEKSPPVTGNAAKSAQIKLALLAGEKGQLGLKTVLPEKSNGQNGLKTVSADTPIIMPVGKVRLETTVKSEKMIPHKEAIADTKAFANMGNIKVKMPDLSGQAEGSEKKTINTTGQTNPSSVKTLTAVAKKVVIPETTAENSGKKTAADGKKTSVQTDLAEIQARLVEKKSLSAASNPAKSTPNTQANAAAGARQAQSKSSDHNGKESEHAGKEPSNIPVPHRLNVSDVQVSVDQPKEQDRPTGQKGPSGNFVQLLSHGSGQIPAGQQPVASAAYAKPAGSPGQNPGADVGKQIFESIHSSLTQQRGDQQITVRLNPPELGKVFIKLQERDAELTGILEVSRAQTRAQIEHALPQMIRNLADCGIQVKRLDVVLSEQGQSGQEAFGGQSPQNNGPYEHGSMNQEAWSNETNVPQVGEWSTANVGYQTASGWQEAFVTDGSINMLI